MKNQSLVKAPVLRHVSLAFAAIFVLFAGLFTYDLAYPPNIDAPYRLPNSNTQILMRLTRSHPWLAEYKRTLLLTYSNGASLSVELFPDTGGYSRAQLYLGADGIYYVKGYFDSARIDVANKIINALDAKLPTKLTYLGAFDEDIKRRKWKFYSAEESKEQSLEAGGG